MPHVATVTTVVAFQLLMPSMLFPDNGNSSAFVGERLGERGPAGPRLELHRSVEHRGAATDARVPARLEPAAHVVAEGPLGGGVAANSLLREQFLDACAQDGIHGFLPSRPMCTDNAAMIASVGWFRLRSDGPTPLSVGASPNLRLFP
jgi:hypothetical protein